MAKRLSNIETTTHAAGPAVQVKNRTIQRCAVCGEKLHDSADTNMATVWTEGQMVRAECGFLRGLTEQDVFVKKIPPDFCIALVER